MSYQLETASQVYGDNLYLAHNLKSDTAEADRFLFGQRVPSYGIINFGYMKAGTTKIFRPLDNGINSDILLRSVYSFTTAPANEEVTFNLFNGREQLLEQRIPNSEMPYTFPPGAIINPNLTITVTCRYETAQLLIYWQPVHVLSFIQV